MTQISPGSISITPNSVQKRILFCCATISISPSALKKCSRSIDLVTSSTWLAMPVCASASPAVVIVNRPVTKVSAFLGIGVGDQRNCPIGRSVLSWAGAVRMKPASTFWKRPVCRTVGRMR